MADENKIGLQAVFEDEEFQKGISDYNKSVADSTDETEKGASSMGQAWEGLSAIGGVAWGVLAGAIAAGTAELYLAIDAAMESQDVMAALDFQIGKTGEDTGITKDQVLGLADSLSKVLPIDDEVITSAITLGMRFDGVTKDNIEPLLKAAADLSTSTGKTLPASMKELALAITDPDKAMRLFRDANITLTDKETEQLKTMKEHGDAAGVTAFILGKVNEKIGGLAQTMGKTASGKAKIFQTALGNIQETLAGPLLDALSGAFDELTNFASDPKTLAFIADLGAKIGELASVAMRALPGLITAFEDVVKWLDNNRPVIVGILAVITAAMAAFAISAGAAFLATAEISVPLIAAIAAIGAIAAIVAKAWEEDWGGIREAVAKAWARMKPVVDKLQAWIAVNLPKFLKVLADIWEKNLLPAMKVVFAWIADNLIPALADLVEWLGDNLPKAISALANFWEKVLLPAINRVSNFITGTLFPIFSSLVTWLSSNLTSALQTLSAIWTGVLLPALNAVWSFINSYIIPLLNALSNLVGAVVGVAVRVFAGIWQNVLLPALSSVWGFISSNLLPIFNAIGNVINTVVRPAIENFGNWLKNTAISLFTPFYNWLNNTFLQAWNGIKQAIQFVIDRINDLVTALNNLTLPDWLTPGSPTPLEMGLKGINEQIGLLTKAGLPVLEFQMSKLEALRMAQPSTGQYVPGSVSNNNTSNNTFLYGAQFNLPGPSGLIETLQGLNQ